MKPQQYYCILDFETYSPLDLKKVGVHEYADHPETEVLCAAWMLGIRENFPTTPINWTINSWDILKAVAARPDIMLIAHNAMFERTILSKVLKIHTEQNRWICTASLAAALALPRNLEGACKALGLKHQKDMEGHRLMLKLCKPRRPTLHNPSTRHSDPEDLQRLIKYCCHDIVAEIGLFMTLPPLSDNERKVWLLDQKINNRGFRVDRELVETTLELVAKELEHLDEETCELTEGTVRSTTQREKTLKWFNRTIAPIAPIENLQAKTIVDFLAKRSMPDDARRVLEIRQDVSKTSTAKYHAFELRSRGDGRCRDNLLYHGASTGRFSGQGVQVQNFPRGKIKETSQAIKIIKETKDIELLRLLYGSPMEVFSSCLRGVITATSGKELFCADYAAIEARVLFWVAKHDKGLRAFEQNRDLYVEMAAAIFRKPEASITKDERFLGKTAVLGCGYGVGKKKFKMTCEAGGVDISEELAELAVTTYRSTHWPVPQLWAHYEQAVFAAVQNPGTKYTINYCRFWVENNFLWVELPSKRKLAYYGPKIQYDETPWGEKRPKFYCWNVDSTTKKWSFSGLWAGVFTENIVQAISRDLMVDAMLRMEEHGYEVILSVHDELLAEKGFFEGDLKEFETIMSTTPDWGKGIPVKVEGWVGERYRK